MTRKTRLVLLVLALLAAIGGSVAALSWYAVEGLSGEDTTLETRVIVAGVVVALAIAFLLIREIRRS